MKRILLIVTIICSAFGAFAGAMDDSLKSAEAAYQKANFTKAIALYESVSKQGFTSAGLEYNLGNAYYRTNNLAKAILHYERALMLDPSFSDAEFNLDVARARQTDKIDAIPQFFLFAWYNALVSSATANTWTYASILLFILCLVGVYLFLFSRSAGSKRLLFSGVLVLFSLSLLTFVFARKQTISVTERSGAVVMSGVVTAKSSPDDSGTQLFVIHEGLKVTIADAVGEWVKISIPNGSVGWVKKADLENI